MRPLGKYERQCGRATAIVDETGRMCQVTYGSVEELPTCVGLGMGEVVSIAGVLRALLLILLDRLGPANSSQQHSAREI